jgi:hypothetical protein
VSKQWFSEIDTMKSDLDPMRFKVDYWWLMFLAGVTFMLLGIWIGISSIRSYQTADNIFAFCLMFSGLLEIFFAINNFENLARQGKVTSIVGVIDLSLGLCLATIPKFTLMIIPVFLGLWILFRGCMAVISTLQLRIYSKLYAWLWLLLASALIVLLPLFFLEDAIIKFENPIIWTGLCLLLSGISRIYLSLHIKY